MASITVNATASLSANGTSVSTGSISWSVPSLPDGVTKWDSVTISGTWSWNGKGNVQYVTINGTNTSADIAFSIPLSTTVTSPLSISCNGNNKNATGSNFSWSNLILNYNYTEPLPEMYLNIKENGSWKKISKVYKKINGIWVEQTDIFSVFDTNANYVKG